jgi:hypothetical protein
MKRPSRSGRPRTARRLRIEPLENRHLLASIAGLVWNDLNADGARQTGENPFVDVTVYLDANYNGALDAGEISTKSGNDGAYLLADVATGNHLVRQVVPGNHLRTAPQLSGARLFAIDTDTNPDRVVELNPTTGAELNNFVAPVASSFGAAGLAFDGQTIHFLSDSNDTLYELNPASGAILDSTVLPSASYGGLAALGGKVYVLNTTSRALTIFNPVTNAITAGPDLDSVNSGLFPRGSLGQSHVTGELVVATSDYIAFIDPVTGRRTGSVPATNTFSTNNAEALGGELFVGVSFTDKLDVYNRASGAFLRSLNLTFAPVDTASFVDPSGAHRVSLTTSNQTVNNLDFGVQYALGNVRGTRWSDTNGDGVRQAGEQPLAGRQVYLDINGDGIRNGSGGLEPDNYVDGTVLNTVHPGITLSRVDANNNPAAFNVVAKTDTWGYTSTGVKSFAYGAGVDWWNNASRLKMAFKVPVSRVTIDFTGGSASGTEIGRLNAYNAAGELIGSYLTSSLEGGEDETMSVVRSLPDIAYAVAYTETGTFGMLDNLTYGILEPTATTAADGSYEFSGLAAGEYTLKAVVAPGATQTFPDLSVDRLFAADAFQDKIFELNPATGAVIKSVPVPGDTFITMGLAFDGKTLWFLSDDTDTLYRLNPDTGAVLGSTALAQGSYQELAALGGLIYVQDMFDGKIYVFDPAASAIVRTITTTGYPDAFIYDGLGEMTGPDRLLERGLHNELLIVDPATGQISVSFSLQLSTPYGLASVGKEIFAGNSSGRIDVYSRSGALLRTFNDAPDVFALAGAAGANGAHKVTLAPNQTLTGLDFGSGEPGNTPPMARDDSLEAREDTSLIITPADLLNNDTDAEGVSLTIVKQSDPAHGTLTANQDGSFTYIPALNYFGPDDFTYRASDGQLTGNLATVSILVQSRNDPPTSQSKTIFGLEDTTHTFSTSDFAVTDADENPTHGLLNVLMTVPSVSTGKLRLGGVDQTPGAEIVVARAQIEASELQFVPAAHLNALNSTPLTIAFRVQDNGGTALGGEDISRDLYTVSFGLTAVNDPPSFTKGNNPSASDEDGPISIPGWVTQIAPGPAIATEEAGQTAVFEVTYDHAELFLQPPQVDISGNLSFTPAPNVGGESTLTVRLIDSGGADNGGASASAAQSFSIRIIKIHALTNAVNRLDATFDGTVAPDDALAVINVINGFGSGRIDRPGFPQLNYVDIVPDDAVAPNDALDVINYLNARPLGPTVSNSLAFLGEDRATRGDWPSQYGAGGHAITNLPVDLPLYVTAISFSGGLADYYTTTHALTTTDPRALRKPGAADRQAAEWAADGQLSLNVKIASSQPQRVALYFLDWERAGRSQRVELYNADTGELLDVRTLADFREGVYLAWNLRGNFRFRFTNLANGPSTVVSGIFFN